MRLFWYSRIFWYKETHQSNPVLVTNFGTLASFGIRKHVDKDNKGCDDFGTLASFGIKNLLNFN